MRPAVAPPTPAASAKADRMIDTSTSRSVSLWHEVLTLQVDLFHTAEVVAFAASPAWARSRTVLEAGCGNGRYLAALAGGFPGKRYLGVDRSAELIALAEDEHAGPAIDFTVADFMSAAGRNSFDAVVMRFVVQHLSDLPAILRQAATYLKPGGTLFVIEPDLASSRNAPPTPVFDAMLRQYAASAAARGRLRVKLSALPAMIADRPGWTIARDAAFSVDSDGPFAATDLLHLYEAWTGLCENQGTFEFDFAAVRDELVGWSRLGAATSRIALRMIEATWSGGVNDRN